MDIPRYIGLFLVKNKYVSITGLGTLELVKKGASYQGETIESPRYDIKFKNVSSIDDQLPNFIGVQENISSNNATNAISKFSKDVKAATANGAPFVMDGIGRFVSNNGSVSFQPVSEFDAGEFTLEPPVALNTAEQDNTRNAAPGRDPNQQPSSFNYSNIEEKGKGIGKILIPIAALSLLAGLIYFGYNYMQGKKELGKDPETKIAEVDTAQIAPIAADTTVLDTTKIIKDTTAIAAAPKADSVKAAAVTKVDSAAKPVFNGPAMNVVARTYSSQASADIYAKKLKGFGKNTSVRMLDSANFQVVISLDKTDKPAVDIVNEIRSFYNPGEKFGKVVPVK
jgi:hypothetical protein